MGGLWSRLTSGVRPLPWLACLLFLILSCPCLLFNPPPAPAADRVWTGGSLADSTWGTAANWEGNILPGNNDSIVFNDKSIARWDNANSLPGLTGINIQADSKLGHDIRISGNWFQLNANGIDNRSSHTLTINNDFSFNISIFCLNTGGPIIFNGFISINGGDLFLQSLSPNPGTSHVIGNVISGVGGLYYSADGPTVCELRAPQNYNGSTVVRTHGTLRLVGGGSLPSGTYLYLEHASATFDLNGNNQTVGHLGGWDRCFWAGPPSPAAATTPAAPSTA